MPVLLTFDHPLQLTPFLEPGHPPFFAQDLRQPENLLHFEEGHARRETPEDVAEVVLSLAGQASMPLAAALADAKLASSRSEARRLVTQGGVTVNGERASDPQAPLGPGEYLVKVGKRHFARLRIA